VEIETRRDGDWFDVITPGSGEAKTKEGGAEVATRCCREQSQKNGEEDPKIGVNSVRIASVPDREKG